MRVAHLKIGAQPQTPAAAGTRHGPPACLFAESLDLTRHRPSACLNWCEGGVKRTKIAEKSSFWCAGRVKRTREAFWPRERPSAWPFEDAFWPRERPSAWPAEPRRRAPAATGTRHGPSACLSRAFSLKLTRYGPSACLNCRVVIPIVLRVSGKIAKFIKSIEANMFRKIFFLAVIASGFCVNLNRQYRKI